MSASVPPSFHHGNEPRKGYHIPTETLVNQGFERFRVTKAVTMAIRKRERKENASRTEGGMGGRAAIRLSDWVAQKFLPNIPAPPLHHGSTTVRPRSVHGEAWVMGEDVSSFPLHHSSTTVRTRVHPRALALVALPRVLTDVSQVGLW